MNLKRDWQNILGGILTAILFLFGFALLGVK